MENTLKNRFKFIIETCYQNKCIYGYSHSKRQGYIIGNNEPFGIQISRMGPGSEVVPRENVNPELIEVYKRPLSLITDEEAIHVARLAHQRPDAPFTILRRDKDLIHVEFTDKIGMKYHISMLYNYGTICANMFFPAHGDKDARNSTVNIGQINLSSARPIPYIAIIDYLRESKFAMPYHGLSVEKQVEYGWIKITGDAA